MRKTLALVVSVVAVFACKARGPQESRALSAPPAAAGEVDLEGAFGTFDSSLGAEATSDQSLVGVHYMKYVGAGNRRHSRCTVQHGYGITPDAYKMLGSETRLRKFVPLYFGAETVETLLAAACDVVYVLFQESNDSSILELTRRVERFQRDVGCTNETGTCAFVGHSKGGAVATAMARRCMQQRSEMGETVCRRTAKFYSATGVPLGAGATALVYGAYRSDDEAIRKKLKGAFASFDPVGVVSSVNESFARSLGLTGNLVWKLFAPYEQNPTWRDLSPGAPMEDGTPLFVANNVRLERQGWLEGDYAATGTRYKFAGGLTDLVGCGEGTGPALFNWNRDVCRLFDLNVGVAHRSGLKDTYYKGLGLMRADRRFYDPSKGHHDFLPEYTWDEYQTSDGLADLRSALGVCRLGGTAVKGCTEFSGINHQASAGGSREALADMVAQLAQ